MELVIGICDDQLEQIKLLKRYLNRVSEQFKLTVIDSANPLKFLSLVKEKRVDLLFLDIDMEGLNGIELAERIKEECEDIVIVYITAHEKYAVDAFRIRAFHYLIKPLTGEKFQQVFNEAVEFLQKKEGNEKRIYTIQNKDETIPLSYDDIYYFEKDYHRIKVYCENKIIEFYGSFKGLLQDLDNDRFIRCHQGYIVNIRKIKYYRDKEIIIKDGIQLPVSRSNIAYVKKKLAARLFNGDD